MMSALEKLFAATNALKAGESLKEPAMWKNVQSLMNVFVVIIATVIKFVDIPVDDSQVNAIAYGLATLAVMVNVYLTHATSTKVGL
jgi:hypothetical protein